MQNDLTVYEKRVIMILHKQNELEYSVLCNTILLRNSSGSGEITRVVKS